MDPNDPSYVPHIGRAFTDPTCRSSAYHRLPIRPSPLPSGEPKWRSFDLRSTPPASHPSQRLSSGSYGSHDTRAHNRNGANVSTPPDWATLGGPYYFTTSQSKLPSPRGPPVSTNPSVITQPPTAGNPTLDSYHSSASHPALPSPRGPPMFKSPSLVTHPTTAGTMPRARTYSMSGIPEPNGSIGYASPKIYHTREFANTPSAEINAKPYFPTRRASMSTARGGDTDFFPGTPGTHIDSWPLQTGCPCSSCQSSGRDGKNAKHSVSRASASQPTDVNSHKKQRKTTRHPDVVKPPRSTPTADATRNRSSTRRRLDTEHTENPRRWRVSGKELLAWAEEQYVLQFKVNALTEVRSDANSKTVTCTTRGDRDPVELDHLTDHRTSMWINRGDENDEDWDWEGVHPSCRTCFVKDYRRGVEELYLKATTGKRATENDSSITDSDPDTENFEHLRNVD